MMERVGLHIDDRAALEAALTAMEGDDRLAVWRWLPSEHRHQGQGLSATLEQAARAYAEYVARGDQLDDGDDARIHAMGEVIYGRYGNRRYVLRGDGYVYLITGRYSEAHEAEGTAKAIALGFRMN